MNKSKHVKQKLNTRKPIYQNNKKKKYDDFEQTTQYEGQELSRQHFNHSFYHTTDNQLH